MKTEDNYTERYTSERVRGMVVEQPKQEDLSSILGIIFAGWINANQNVELGITKKDLAREHYHRFEGVAGERWKEQIINPKVENISLLARSPDGEVVGFCRAKEQDETNVITGLYVLQEVHRKGIGTMLMNNVIDKLNPLKPTILRVATYNYRAIAFYRRLGFKPTELREDFQMKYSGKRIPIMKMRREPIAA